MRPCWGSHRVLKGPFSGPSKGPATATTAFSEKERALIQRFAEQEGLSFEEAVERLFSDGLARRIKARTGRSPSAAVLNFRGRR